MMAVASVTTFYPRGVVRYLLWAAYVQTSVRTAAEGWHYSVDFIIPLALFWYVWRDLAWVYPSSAMLPRTRLGSPAQPVSRAALAVLVAVVCFAVLMAFYIGG